MNISEKVCEKRLYIIPLLRRPEKLSLGCGAVALSANEEQSF